MARAIAPSLSTVVIMTSVSPGSGDRGAVSLALLLTCKPLAEPVAMFTVVFGVIGMSAGMAAPGNGALYLALRAHRRSGARTTRVSTTRANPIRNNEAQVRLRVSAP